MSLKDLLNRAAKAFKISGTEFNAAMLERVYDMSKSGVYYDPVAAVVTGHFDTETPEGIAYIQRCKTRLEEEQALLQAIYDDESPTTPANG